MTTTEEEGNKIIAEFDNYEQVPEGVNEKFWKYHTSFDWLMPVVKKWNDLVISKRTEGNAGWTKWQYKTVMLRTEIAPVFKDLVETIKWYNQNK